MNFDGFQRFAVDFGIFPDILSKPKIFRFFHTLANFYQEAKLPGTQLPSNNARSRGRVLSPGLAKNTDFCLQDRPEFNCNVRNTTGIQAKNQEFIDEHLFIEALALAAFEVVYRAPSPSNIEKIILLMERMTHSDGPRKIQLEYGVTRFGPHGESGADITALLRQSYPSYFLPQAV